MTTPDTLTADDLALAIEKLDSVRKGELAGHRWALDRVLDAATNQLARMREAEPIDEETASALRLWKEDHEATRDYYASLRIQEQTAAFGTLDRLLRSAYRDARLDEGLRALEAIAKDASGVASEPQPSPPLEALDTLWRLVCAGPTLCPTHTKCKQCRPTWEQARRSLSAVAAYLQGERQ